MTRHRLIAIVAMLSAFPLNADELVNRADANGDGYVSLYELRAAYYADAEFNRRIEQSFADYDTDGDGLISEAERRTPAIATAEDPPGAGIAATASNEPAATPATGAAPATAEAPASTPVAAPKATTTEVPPTPAAELSAAAGAEIASTPGSQTASMPPPAVDAGTDGPGGRSPEVAPSLATADEALVDTSGLSRSELWIHQIDADNSGGASIEELAASGDGNQWLQDSDFRSADKNGDDELDPDELEMLIQSMERRQRR